jgi:hypothetical protein
LCAVHCDKQQRFISEHENRGALKKMYSNDRSAGRERSCALYNRWNIASGIVHSKPTVSLEVRRL